LSTGSYVRIFFGNEPLKADSFDQTVRFLTFNPARISAIREKQWRERQLAVKFQERRSAINSELKKYYLFGKGDYAEIAKKIQKYNETVIGLGRADIRPITGQSIRSMLRQAQRPNRLERTRASAANS
jgi:hypothetical protein